MEEEEEVCPNCGAEVPVIDFFSSSSERRSRRRCRKCRAHLILSSHPRVEEKIPLPYLCQPGQPCSSSSSFSFGLETMGGRCPDCFAPYKQDACVPVNDGGSVMCWRCGTTYHCCKKDGKCRTGYSPKNCPHCLMPQAQAQGKRGGGDYLGNLYIGAVPKKKGDYLGDFCSGEHCFKQ
jgi:hypothetical protein